MVRRTHMPKKAIRRFERRISEDWTRLTQKLFGSAKARQLSSSRALLAAALMGFALTLSAPLPALAATDYIDLKPADHVFWRGRDGQNFLIINVFPKQQELQALPALQRNELLINTALVQGAREFESSERAGLASLKLLIVSMANMSEYGSSDSKWTQVATGELVKASDHVEIRDLKVDGDVPQPLPTVPFPFVEKAQGDAAAAAYFQMPERLYLVAGQTQRFFYEDLVATHDIDTFVYTPSGSAVGLGSLERRGLRFEPTEGMVGKYELNVKVATWNGKLVAEGNTEVIVTSANMRWQPSPDVPTRLWIIGHSLPSMYYPAYLDNFLAGPGNPTIEFLGGIKYWYGGYPDFDNKPDLDHLVHQASPGYSLSTLLNLYSEDPPANPNMPTKSPFIFKDADGKPKFDMQRYFVETLHGKAPDFILLNVGDNDTWTLDPAAKDSAIEKDFVANLNKFVDQLRTIAPKATIGMIMPNTYNFSDNAFLANYGANTPRLRQMQIRQRFIQMATAVAKSRGDLKIVPSNFSVDSVDGMPFNSATHFNNVGARQFAGSIYAWLKAQFAEHGGKSEAVTAVAPTTPPVTQTAPPPASGKPGWFRGLYARLFGSAS